MLKKLGPQAIIYPGQQQHARAAIQFLSVGIEQQRVFTHPGWRSHESGWIYLHSGGAVGADGSISGIHVQMPTALQEYRLSSPPDPEASARAIRDSLRFSMWPQIGLLSRCLLACTALF